MPCNRKNCPHPVDHVHLRLRDEHAIANVLLGIAAGRYTGVMIKAGMAGTARERDTHGNRTTSEAAGPEG
jgi:hypothetical protein